MISVERNKGAIAYFPIVVGVSLLLGAACLFLPPLFVLAGAAGVLYIVIVIAWPEYALLGILFLTSTIIDFYKMPSVPIGFGNLIITDIVLFVPLGILFLRVVLDPQYAFIRTPLDLPLLGFYGLALLFTFIAIFKSTVSFNQSLGEVRSINFYLIFFIVTNLIRDKKHLRRLLNGILFLAIFTSLAMIAQYLLGDRIHILTGRVETLYTAGVLSAGITRVLPPGQSLVMVGFLALFVITIIDRTNPITLKRMILLAILGLSVLLTFNRNFWVGIGLAVFLIACLVPSASKLRIVNLGFISICIGVIVAVPVMLTKSEQTEKLINGAMIRLTSLVNPKLLTESSLRYRFEENTYAISTIISHPFVGVELGGHYRPWDQHIDSWIMSYDKLAYIHNGHFWVMLKTGVLGYFCLMWLVFRHLKRGFQNWKNIPDPFSRGILFSFTITIIAILPAALLAPIFSDSFWTPVLAIMMGINEVIINLYLKPSKGLLIYDKYLKNIAESIQRWFERPLFGRNSTKTVDKKFKVRFLDPRK